MDLYDLGRYNPNYWRVKLFSDKGFRNAYRYATADTPMGTLDKVYDNFRSMNDYLTNRGLTWSDLKYPSITKGAGLTAYNMWSSDVKSLERMYENDSKRVSEKNRRDYFDRLRDEHYRESIKANNMRRAWYYSRM